MVFTFKIIKYKEKKLKAKNINIKGKEFLTKHFYIKSNDESLSDEKKFEFDVWYNPENNLILKVICLMLF